MCKVEESAPSDCIKAQARRDLLHTGLAPLDHVIPFCQSRGGSHSNTRYCLKHATMLLVGDTRVSTRCKRRTGQALVRNQRLVVPFIWQRNLSRKNCTSSMMAMEKESPCCYAQVSLPTSREGYMQQAMEWTTIEVWLLVTAGAHAVGVSSDPRRLIASGSSDS